MFSLVKCASFDNKDAARKVPPNQGNVTLVEEESTQSFILLARMKALLARLAPLVILLCQALFVEKLH